MHVDKCFMFYTFLYTCIKKGLLKKNTMRKAFTCKAYVAQRTHVYFKRGWQVIL